MKQQKNTMPHQGVTFMLALFILIGLSSPVIGGLIDDMVILDRSYIPALALTNQSDKPAGAVVESMRRLNSAWPLFIRSLSKADRESPVLAQAVSVAGAKIQEANGLVAAGKRKDAHEALETVRNAFWKARAAMNIQYLPDLMTAFHEPMEHFYDLVVRPGSNPKDLAALLEELSARWADVEKTRPDPKLFGLNEEQVGRFTVLVKKEREILTKLSGILRTGNAEAISKTAGSMKGTFAQAYLVFGDFSGL